MEAELKEIEAQSEQLQLEGQAAISEYKELRQRLKAAEQSIAAAVQQPDRALAFLRPGRLVRVREGEVRRLADVLWNTSCLFGHTFFQVIYLLYWFYLYTLVFSCAAAAPG